MKQAFYPKYIFVFILSLTSFSAFPAVCNEESINFKTQGDKYFEIEKSEKLTKDEIYSINKIHSSINKRIKGTAKYKECYGSISKPKEKISKLKTTGKISLNSDNKLAFELTYFNKEKKKSYNKRFTFFDKKTYTQIMDLSDTGFIIATKSRIPGQKTVKGSRITVIVEEISELSFSGKNLYLNIVRYINGSFADEYKMTFNM